MKEVYCSKSIVRKALQQAALRVEKLKAPPGKREILRAENQAAHRLHRSMQNRNSKINTEVLMRFCENPGALKIIRPALPAGGP